MQQLLDDNVAGLMIWTNAEPTKDTIHILKKYQERHIPIVFVDRLIEGIEADYVASENFGGTYDVVNHLIELGHQHIVLLTPDIGDLQPINERQRGYQTAIQEQGMYAFEPWRIKPPVRSEFHETDIYSLVGEQSQQIIEQVMRLMNNVEPKPSAIVCINDILAIIAISALRNIGFEIPNDVSVVGFDDISMASYIGVPLTTVAQNAYELGRIASQMLMQRLDGSDVAPRCYTVPTRLHVRMSSAEPAFVCR